MKKNFLLIVLGLLFSGILFAQDKKKIERDIEFHGHRGARGLMPENTIPAFIKAIDLGVTAVELDVVVSSDRLVVVSHDHYFSKTFCITPNGDKIKNENKHILYKKKYDEIIEYDCGCVGHPKYPHQKKISAYKPLLTEVIDTIESYIIAHKKTPVIYNIEIKTKGTKYHPPTLDFVKIVHNAIASRGIEDRVIIQSFNHNVLGIVKKEMPLVKTLLLVLNLRTVKGNLKKLGFVPNYYSPYYRLVSKRTIKRAHDRGMKLVTWTVNKEKKIHKLIDNGVDGIMTDYPNLINELNLK